MKRKIKFRAWDKEDCVMRYPKNENLDEYYPYIVITPNGQTAISDFPEYRKFDCELMQYTGLKDKNGKKIYEGDIIKAYDHNEKIYYIQEIIYDKYGFFAKDEDGLWLIESYEYTIDEIIGNIYENPELLT